jgi:putative endonuclease
MKDHNYFVYIITNPARTVLYVGVTNNLRRRIQEHYEQRGRQKTFAGRYFCFNLVYFERFSYPNHAISREKEIKKWRREKKDALINSFNPEWRFLNDEIKD